MKKYYEIRLNPLFISFLFIVLSINWFQISRILISSVSGNIISDSIYSVLAGTALYWLILKSNKRQHEIIDELSANEKELKGLIEEKEVLLSEIHHRVKNNLAIISGLIELQAFELDNPEISCILTNTQRRIKSIALVHEKLYQDYLFSEIEFDQYLHDLVQAIDDIYNCTKHNIQIDLQTIPLVLDMQHAIPLGLLASELITNSYKNLFSVNERGVIKVALKSQDDDSYEFHVRDNGYNSGEYKCLSNTSNLEFKLIETLSKQINGNVEMDTSEGFRTSISFHLNGICKN